MVTTQTRQIAGPPPPPPPPGPGRRTPKRRTVRRALIAAALVLLAIPAWSLGHVLLANNTDPLGVRVVEWARDHHLNGLVNDIERLWYSHHQPKRGGTPRGGIPQAASRALQRPAAARHVAIVPGPGRRPPNITPFVASPLPGEGVWQPVGRAVHGTPVAWVAYLRPDAVHTGELVGVAHFDMHALAATLHAGTQLPGGGPWQHGARVDPADYGRVVAAFNSGFKLRSSGGGYYAEGHTVKPLVDGVASFVTYRDGHANIGIWGRDVTMTPDVTAVRQNLGLLVDQGALASGLGNDHLWGGTLGNKVYVWRSAVGIDAHGDLIYAAGPGLDVATIASVMQRAGAVRAMELDINSSWVTLTTFTGDGHGGVTPAKLLNSMQRPADRYLVDGTRDFIELDAR